MSFGYVILTKTVGFYGYLKNVATLFVNVKIVILHQLVFILIDLLNPVNKSTFIDLTPQMRFVLRPIDISALRVSPVRPVDSPAQSGGAYQYRSQ